jgi:hypothetical protein
LREREYGKSEKSMKKKESVDEEYERKRRVWRESMKKEYEKKV